VSHQSRRLAGILLVVFPTVIYGGVSLLWLLTNDPRYEQNELRQDLWRAGHAHAGVLLILSLLVLRYVDEAELSQFWKSVARHATPTAAILLPLAYFLSMPLPRSTEPNALIYLAYIGAMILAVGLFVLGIGLLKRNTNKAVNTS
jgi:hypothetical protein